MQRELSQQAAKFKVADLNADEKRALFKTLARAMALDRMMMRLIRSGKMVGFYHEGGIAMAAGVAAGFFLNKDDIMWPHYRAHGMAHMLGKRVDIKRYVAEHMGREAGCCKGRSSYHMSFPEDHIFGYSGNIGANFPLSVGYGFAAKYKDKGQVVMNCSGDGSYGEGRCHEAMLISATWKLPVIFWCENNSMAQHSSLDMLFPIQDISRLAKGYGIEAHIVDGQNLFECAQAARAALQHVRSGLGPIFIECKTLRAQEHNVGGLNYAGPNPRSIDLMTKWKSERNPLQIASAALIAEGSITKSDVEEITRVADQEADDIEAFADSSPKAMPTIEAMEAALYSS
jgi:pyruvate dehydrogenase E1 component alpha subunit